MDDLDELLAEHTPPGEPAADYLTAAELGDWLGLTGSRVSQLGREGILPREPAPGRKVHRYPLRASVRAYCEHTRAAVHRHKGNPELEAEKLRLTKANADKAEVATAKARGELVPASEVTGTVTGLMVELRNALLAAPERVASTVGLDRAATLALDAEIRAALTELADRADREGVAAPAEQPQEG